MLYSGEVLGFKEDMKIYSDSAYNYKYIMAPPQSTYKKGTSQLLG
jgi:hypothetical protein